MYYVRMYIESVKIKEYYYLQNWKVLYNNTFANNMR